MQAQTTSVPAIRSTSPVQSTPKALTRSVPKAAAPKAVTRSVPKAAAPKAVTRSVPKAAAAETVAPEVVDTDRRSSVARSYVVKSGDTLAKIATAQNITGGYQAIFALNRATIENVNLIYPGEILRLR